MKKRVSIYIDEGIWEDVRERAWRDRISASAMFERLISGKLEDERKSVVIRDEVPDPVRELPRKESVPPLPEFPKEDKPKKKESGAEFFNPRPKTEKVKKPAKAKRAPKKDVAKVPAKESSDAAQKIRERIKLERKGKLSMDDEILADAQAKLERIREAK